MAVARYWVEAKNYPEADQQYQFALARKPDYLPALLGYAELKDAIGRPGEAQQLYQLALKAHPKQPAIYNNLGLSLRGADGSTRRSRPSRKPRNWILKTSSTATTWPRYSSSKAGCAKRSGTSRRCMAIAVAYYNLGYMLNCSWETAGGRAALRLGLAAPTPRWLPPNDGLTICKTRRPGAVWQPPTEVRVALAVPAAKPAPPAADLSPAPMPDTPSSPGIPSGRSAP